MILALLVTPSCATPARPSFTEKRDLSSHQTEINSMMATFPHTLPGARVRKLVVPQSKYCLIHIRSRHLYTNLSNIKEFKEIQDDIYQTLQFLNNKYAVKGVYLEGVSAENMGFITSVINQLKSPSKEKLSKRYTLEATFKMASEGNIKIYPAENSTLIKSVVAQKEFNQSTNYSSINKLIDSYRRSPRAAWRR